MRLHSRLAWTVAGLLAASAARAEPAPSAEALKFFENKVRPVLAEHCYNCHGPKKQMGGGLRMDTRDGVLKGGDGGPAVVPGDPTKSPMIRAIEWAGDVKMPPKTKLPPDAVAVLTTWVKMGAPWPAGGNDTATAPPDKIQEAARKHWAFQPVKLPALPEVKNAAWVRTPVDRFILAKLEDKGYAPAAAADRRTLVRRATFDLIGLPPTPEELDAAQNDQSPEWFAKVVDRLLASPHYGERWGRHWLDVARYADTKGYVFLEERKFPASYTYRDYVVRAFNDDLPYNQFILEQLAADQLPKRDDARYLAAMGYLTLGRRFLNNVHDIIDDRIDVAMRGLQGLTVTCARCHDHKFDPIPTKDYYSLYGVFSASVEPKDLPLIGDVERTAAFIAYEKELQTREQSLQAGTEKKYAELLQKLRGQVGDYLIAVRDGERQPGEEAYQPLNPGELNPEITNRWQQFLAGTRKQHHPIFAAWHQLAALPQKEFAEKAKELAPKLAANDDGDKKLNPLVAKLFADRVPATLRDAARWYGELFAETDKQWRETNKDGKLKALPDADREALRQVLHAANTPTALSLDEVQNKKLFDRAAREHITGLKKKIDELKANSPAAPPRAMVLNDVPKPGPTHVLVRGNPNNRGEAVPRQFLAILSGPQRKPFANGSGRLELAQAIASESNPLTARVMANRIWLHHFGQGIVRTPSDFGLRSETPTHPELLDWLAATFMESGWSVKKLHRQIVLSSAYQQSSTADPKQLQADVENRLVGRMNRRRLDFEQLRDSLLAVTGKLDPAVGGPAVEITAAPYPRRRTLYAFIERQNLPGVFRTFDLASPDVSTGQRYTTTVPQQALFLMNSPFVVEQARRVATRFADEPDVAQRITQMYRYCYGRTPDADELALGKRFLDEASKEAPSGKQPLAPWEQYAQVLLLGNEFAFVD